MTTPETKPKHRGTLWWLALVCLLLYFLSMGPAQWLLRRPGFGRGFAPTYELVYAPVFWLEHRTALTGVIERYLNVWREMEIGTAEETKPTRRWRFGPRSTKAPDAPKEEQGKN